MRSLADAERIRRFMDALGPEVTAATRVYFTGGATAVLQGWRTATIDPSNRRSIGTRRSIRDRFAPL